jgi:hypothetical protein
MRRVLSQQLQAALFRSLLGGVVLAGGAFFGTLTGDLAQGQGIGGTQLLGAGIATGFVFFTNLAVRFAAEGLIDSAAANNGGRRIGDPSPPPAG